MNMGGREGRSESPWKNAVTKQEERNSRCLLLNLRLTCQSSKFKAPNEDKEDSFNLDEGESVSDAIPIPTQESQEVTPYTWDLILVLFLLIS